MLSDSCRAEVVGLSVAVPNGHSFMKNMGPGMQTQARLPLVQSVSAAQVEEEGLRTLCPALTLPLLLGSFT